MYILSNKEAKVDADKIYNRKNKSGDRVIYLFESEDDAERYAMLLDTGEMEILPIDEEMTMRICKEYNYKCTLVRESDIVFPPK